MEIPHESSDPTLKIHCISSSSSPSPLTYTYLIASTLYPHNAIIIDPLLAREPLTNALNTTVPDAVLEIIYRNQYIVEHIFETHAALPSTTAGGTSTGSATWYLRTQLLERTGYAPRISVKESLNGIREVYARKYGVRRKFWKGEFDGRFLDGEVLSAGELRVRVVHLPLSAERGGRGGGGGARGDKHVGYVVGEKHVFMGECVFHASSSPKRAGDEEGGREEEEVLKKSRERILSLPSPPVGNLRIWTTRGCAAARGTKGKGCVGELREEHVAATTTAVGDVVVQGTLAGGLDEGVVA